MKYFQLVFHSLIYVWPIIWSYINKSSKCYEYVKSLIWISFYIYENLPYLKKNCFPSKMLKILFFYMLIYNSNNQKANLDSSKQSMVLCSQTV